MAAPLVVVVGVGPAGPELVTAAALDALRCPVRRFPRTGQHPSAVVVDDATTFDHLYDQADTFAEVYGAITEALVDAASREGEVGTRCPARPTSSSAASATC